MLLTGFDPCLSLGERVLLVKPTLTRDPRLLSERGFVNIEPGKKVHPVNEYAQMDKGSSIA
jgi:hypothetical protein